MNANQLGAVFEGRLPSARELHNIAEELSVDVATGVLLKVLSDSKLHGAFASRLRELDPTDPVDRAGNNKQIEITIVASNHFSSRRAWGDHVEAWRHWARDLGFTTDVVDTRATNTVLENARIIRDFLKANPHPARFIVTYGQGAAEFRYLLQRLNLLKATNELSGIQSWINICGTVAGSSLNTYLDTGKLRRFAESLRLRLAGRNPLVLHELNHRAAGWRQVLPIPRSITVLSIPALPLRSEIPSSLYSLFNQLAKDGPNDGVVGFMESVAHPGFIVPAAGMNHQAQDYRLKPIFERAILLLAKSLDKIAERPAELDF